ncbi:hypothetical protein L228DRAFT_279503 [Xylona heveae TC161]|uniref:Auxin efflux carrier n=1 Tax=Xylona heveae (strain CBS 132557 / TC161) TaxID=1328760 RepID=A0A165JI61_XYLHT|nr:hypothetical protein L228DRAFT_279503 [Xylona heveae TC161]KZF26271.1 hypothetical protein L228DRAFT_279503 [Xylona heveae TC161]
MADDGLLSSFLGALQASLSVILTILFGVIAAQFDLLNEKSTKQVSRLCVKLLLPCLLIAKVGSELHLSTALRYVPILIWSIIYTLVSMAIGILATRVLRLPAWATPAICFNNTTSLPLLLVQSLETTGILTRLLASDTDTIPNAISRAQSYFLVCSLVGNSLTFALGPSLLNGGHEEDSPDEPDSNDKDRTRRKSAQSSISNAEQGDDEDDESNSQVSDGEQINNDDQTDGHHPDPNSPAEHGDIPHPAARGDDPEERTPLLPDPVIRRGRMAHKKGLEKSIHYYKRLPPWVREALDFAYAFVNAPVIGGLIGLLVGLVPPLHRVFFNPTEEGGYFNAWLTTAVRNVGNLFAVLQVLVVGVKLHSSLTKKGDQGEKVPWISMVLITFIRFILWPIISIVAIWAIASRTHWLDEDPILWFAMMMMPTGPSAMKLVALADVDGSSEAEKMSIAKFLTITYAISPLICFTVVGSLKASQAAMK